jgi:2-hydroxychromene-2-carboxylate isomerase
MSEGRPFEEGRVLPATSLDFWFDYTCPWAYLGSTVARDVAARMGVALRYRPLLLGGVFRAVRTEQESHKTKSQQRKAYDALDRQRWAAKRGVPLRWPEAHPMRSVDALRATLAVGIDPRVVDGFYRAYWVDNRPISTPEVIRDVLGGAGHDPDAAMAAIGTPAIKEELQRRTDEAVRLGIFGVPTWIVDGVHLYWGQDRISFVEGLRVPATVTSATSAPPARQKLEVYWDFSSPWSYLGTLEAEAVARRTNAEIVWRPMLLGAVFRAINTAEVPFDTFSPAKQRHIRADLARWAAYSSVPFRFASRFPVHSLRALRVYLGLPEARRAAYRTAVFRAAWAEDRDITDDTVLGACIGDDAIARDAFARAATPEIKALLRSETDAAVVRGVFGAPTFFVGDELYWGRDRLELVEEALA